MPHRSQLPTVLALTLWVVACGGGPGLPVASSTKNVSGSSTTAYKVPSGVATAYRLESNAQRGSSIGTSPTDASGAFQLKLAEPSTGPLLISVTGGSYVEPATSTPVNLSGGELTAMIPSQVRVTGDVIAGVLVSPISHLIARLASHYVQADGLSVDAALSKAKTALNSHFGGIDWQTLGPIPDLTDPKAGVVQLNNETKAAIVLAGFSMEARNLSVARGLTPGGPLNSFTLIMALADDLGSDGYFDGVNALKKMTIPSSSGGYTLDGQTVRGMLATAVRGFLSGTANATQVTSADAEPTTLAIAADANSQIFRDNGVGPALTTALSFVAADGTTHDPVLCAGEHLVSGVFNYSVNASSAGSVATLTVAQGSTALTPGAGSAMPTKFVSSIDTTKLPDGPLTFTATATDSAGKVVSRVMWKMKMAHSSGWELTNPSPCKATTGGTRRGEVYQGAEAVA